MKRDEVLKPLGVFVLVIAVILAGTMVVSSLSGAGSASPSDGVDIDGQSPDGFQPSNVVQTSAPEDGEIRVDSSGEEKRILVDSSHGNQYSRSDLEPMVEALSEAGHTVKFAPSSESSGGFGSSSYNSTLQEFDAVLIVQPTSQFSDQEIAGLKAYADGGGRIAVLGEPTQYEVSGGFSASLSEVRFAGNGLTQEFGVRMGSQSLYNVEDSGNDNNFESILATADGDGSLTDGVETVTFDTAGYVAQSADSDAAVQIRAVEGTKSSERRQAGQYPIAVQNDNFVFVADSSFVKPSEVYDLDNDQFVSNILTFLVSGDKDDDVPSGGSGGGGFGGGGNSGGGPSGGDTPTERPPQTPPETPPETPAP